jgi:hypothetical protein
LKLRCLSVQSHKKQNLTSEDRNGKVKVYYGTAEYIVDVIQTAAVVISSIIPPYANFYANGKDKNSNNFYSEHSITHNLSGGMLWVTEGNFSTWRYSNNILKITPDSNVKTPVVNLSHSSIVANSDGSIDNNANKITLTPSGNSDSRTDKIRVTYGGDFNYALIGYIELYQDGNTFGFSNYTSDSWIKISDVDSNNNIDVIILPLQ